MSRVRSEQRLLVRTLLLDAECSSGQSVEAIKKLAQRLDSAQSMEQHWPLIFDLWDKRAASFLRLLAHYVSAFWCATEDKKHEWQIWDALPRNIRFSPTEQRRANSTISKAARSLERALRNPAANPAFRDRELGRVVAAAGGPSTPVVMVPLAAERHGADSVLTRLVSVANPQNIIYSSGWVGRPGKAGARGTYFARRMAQILLYVERESFRPRIERFIADLIVEIASWENCDEDWHSEKVRECLKTLIRVPSVRSKKKSS